MIEAYVQPKPKKFSCMNTQLLASNKNTQGDILEIFLLDKVSIPFCFIPAGKFAMGSPNDEEGRIKCDRGNEYDEAHYKIYNEDQTQISFTENFWLAKTPVTQSQWKAVTGKSKGRFKGVNRPVDGVSYLEVESFIRELTKKCPLPDGWSFTVPTEAQWEYACRAGEEGPYSGGRLDDVAWFENNSNNQTHEVGLKKSNAWGLHDMHGNVGEMCWSNITHKEGVDPAGDDPLSEEEGNGLLVLRGGSWHDHANSCRAANRHKRIQTNDSGNAKLSTYGFRLAIVLSQKNQLRNLGNKAKQRKSERIKNQVINHISLEDKKAGELLNVAFSNKMLIPFCYIPSGSFIMGSPENEHSRDECESQVEVTLSKPFLIAKTPLTQAQWNFVMSDNPSEYSGLNLPVENVSWDDVQQYIDIINEKKFLPNGWMFALPTEAQWEYACRAGESGPYSGGSLEEVGWFLDNSAEEIRDVGLLKPNKWGIHDMHGNVWEWCADWFEDKLSGGIDPHGPDAGEGRVYRGGSAFDGDYSCRAATRYHAPPDEPNYDRGFRLAIVQM